MLAVWSSRISVCGGRYRWDDASGKTNIPRLEPRETGSGEETRVYDVFLDQPVLFYRFSELEPSYHSVLEFADQYGLLWTAPGSIERNTLQEWEEETLRMRWALHVHDILQASNVPMLDRYVVREENGRLASTLPVDGGSKHLGYSWAGPMGECVYAQRTDDSCDAGWRLLSKLVEDSTRDLSPHLIFRRRLGAGPEINLQVEELCSALWLQLAQLVMGEVELRLCERCETPFLLRQETRSDRVFCSGACKRMGIYYRKRQARQMRAEGMSLREIVQAVGAASNSYRQNLQTVKRWLKDN